MRTLAKNMAVPAIKTELKTAVTVVRKMRDYSGEPVFQQKLDSAKAALKKFGLPKSLKKKSK